MTFRKKLMMRNASWHFRSTSQQPSRSPRRRDGLGAGQAEETRRRQKINFAVSIMNVGLLALLLKFRQNQTGTGWGLSSAARESLCGCTLGKGR